MPTSVAASTADTSLSADAVARSAQFSRSTADTSATSDAALHAVLTPTGIPPRDVGQPTIFVHVGLLVFPVGVAPAGAFGSPTLTVTASTVVSPTGIPPV